VSVESATPRWNRDPRAEWSARGADVNVGMVERWFSMVAGGLLTAYGLRHRHASGGAAALAGAALLYRGATGHCDLYGRLGVDRAHASPKGTGAAADAVSDTRWRLSGRRGIHVEESVTILRPIAEVYGFWRDFENLPRFMRHLESVTVREEGVSHWVATGPPGVRVEWDAVIINEIDGTLIAWQSLRGSRVAIAGSVHFDDTPRGTRVRVRFQYQPPGGRLGAALARIFGEEPQYTVHEDLRRFKQLMETGEIPTIEGQPSGRRAPGRLTQHTRRGGSSRLRQGSGEARQRAKGATAPDPPAMNGATR
jgi:uncharacterized membrane protein